MKQFTDLVLVCALILALAGTALAHCDALDGPVIVDARMALEKADVTPVLKWIEQKDEQEVTGAFKKTLDAREQSEEAREMADMSFFETLVNLHRASEGVSYSGLKQAGQIEPAIMEADKAIEDGSVKSFADDIAHLVSEGINERFERVVEAKKHMNESVEAGRKYVAAYVDFIHYAENIHNLASGGDVHHSE